MADIVKSDAKIEPLQPENFLAILNEKGITPDFLMDIAADFFRATEINSTLKIKMDAILKIMKMQAKRVHELDPKTQQAMERIYAAVQQRMSGQVLE